MRHPIATFPNYLKARLPMDERFIFSVLKNNLNRYIQLVMDLIKNPKKFKELTKEKRKKVLRIIKFDKIKLIELFFCRIVYYKCNSIDKYKYIYLWVYS